MQRLHGHMSPELREDVDQLLNVVADLSSKHAAMQKRMEYLEDRPATRGEHHAAMQERMEYVEKLLGDFADNERNRANQNASSGELLWKLSTEISTE